MDEHGTVREGAIVGALGAISVAVWFLIVDTIAGQPLQTPAALGEAVTSVLWPEQEPGFLLNVALYTVFHFVAFGVIGLVVVAIVHGSRRQPAILAGLLILFVAFEVGFYGFTYVLSLWTPLETLAWYQVGAANLLAAVVMGRYLWMRHPEMPRQLDEVLSGR
ncbi:MAG TPA: hypothetical protein VF178_12535 [Gemmatimonadaceae bacterium]